MSDSISYPLYLSSASGAPNLVGNADQANVKYRIDWDTFFNRDNYKYRSCRIRYKFLCQPSPGNAGTYTYNPSTFSGVIVASGIPPVASNTYSDTIIGIINVETVQYLSNTMLVNTTTLSGEDLTSVTGQNIIIPTGLRELNIQLWNNKFYSSNSKLLSDIDSNNIPLNIWNLLLVFELYDRIEA